MTIAKLMICLALGYLLGALNPAELLGRLKEVNLRQTGTQNLGASNTMLTLGKGYGALVMAFDIFKGWLASRIAKALFPTLAVAGLLAGLGAVIGHIFPFYLQFRGGKGLAAFGGMALAYDPMLFLALLLFGLALMILCNVSYVMPMSASVLFVVFVALQTHSIPMSLIAAAASTLIIVKHWSNIGKGRRGEDLDIRGFIRNIFVRA